MSWVADLWKCPECGAKVGCLHLSDCAMLQTGPGAVWLGPQLHPGLVPRVVVEGDVVSSPLLCLHCNSGFVADQVVFETPNQRIAIHASCVIQLGQMIPQKRPNAIEIEEEFEKRRQELLRGQ